MIIFRRYVNQEEHIWYDSSNIFYSKCYDTSASATKTIKIVFKAGRAYVYKDVNVEDYNRFKVAESTGQAFNQLIKKYPAERIADVDLNELNKLMEQFKKEINETNEQKLSDVIYDLKVNDKSGEFIIQLNGKTLFKGIEAQFSILNLFNSLNINYTIENVDEIPNDSDETLNEIKLD